jgi:hypothetical protein
MPQRLANSIPVPEGTGSDASLNLPTFIIKRKRHSVIRRSAGKVRTPTNGGRIIIVKLGAERLVVKAA